MLLAPLRPASRDDVRDFRAVRRARPQRHRAVQARRVRATRPGVTDRARRRPAPSTRCASTATHVLGDNTDGAGLVRDIRAAPRIRHRRRKRVAAAGRGRRCARRRRLPLLAERPAAHRHRQPHGGRRRRRWRRQFASARGRRVAARRRVRRSSPATRSIVVINATSASLADDATAAARRRLSRRTRLPTTWCTAHGRRRSSHTRSRRVPGAPPTAWGCSSSRRRNRFSCGAACGPATGPVLACRCARAIAEAAR